MAMRLCRLGVLVVVLCGCGQGREAVSVAPTVLTSAAPAPLASAPPPSSEPHLQGIKQLTFGGENAEAYWSFGGDQLILQAHQGEGCDQIYRMPIGKAPIRVSTGKGATTCSYFLPGDQ